MSARSKRSICFSIIDRPCGKPGPSRASPSIGRRNLRRSRLRRPRPTSTASSVSSLSLREGLRPHRAGEEEAHGHSFEDRPYYWAFGAGVEFLRPLPRSKCWPSTSMLRMRPIVGERLLAQAGRLRILRGRRAIGGDDTALGERPVDDGARCVSNSRQSALRKRTVSPGLGDCRSPIAAVLHRLPDPPPRVMARPAARQARADLISRRLWQKRNNSAGVRQPQQMPSRWAN